jgi:hypothetical protein
MQVSVTNCTFDGLLETNRSVSSKWLLRLKSRRLPSDASLSRPVATGQNGFLQSLTKLCIPPPIPIRHKLTTIQPKISHSHRPTHSFTLLSWFPQFASTSFFHSHTSHTSAWAVTFLHQWYTLNELRKHSSAPQTARRTCWLCGKLILKKVTSSKWIVWRPVKQTVEVLCKPVASQASFWLR